MYDTKNIAYFTSNSGKKFNSLIEYRNNNLMVNERINLLVVDSVNNFSINYAWKNGIFAINFDNKQYNNNFEYETAILNALKYYNINFILLDEFDYSFSKDFLRKFPDTIYYFDTSIGTFKDLTHLEIIKKFNKYIESENDNIICKVCCLDRELNKKNIMTKTIEIENEDSGELLYNKYLRLWEEKAAVELIESLR